MNIWLIVGAVIVVWMLWFAATAKDREKKARDREAMAREEIMRPIRQRDAREEAATAFLEKVCTLAFNLNVSAHGGAGTQIERSNLAKNINNFARRAAEGGFATHFPGMAECIATSDAVTIFTKSNVLRSLQRERPSEPGAVQRTYVRVGQDHWAYRDDQVIASNVDRAIEDAMQEQCTRLLSAAP